MNVAAMAVKVAAAIRKRRELLRQFEAVGGFVAARCGAPGALLVEFGPLAVQDCGTKGLTVDTRTYGGSE